MKHGGFTKTMHQCVIITSANNVYKHKNDIILHVPDRDLLHLQMYHRVGFKLFLNIDEKGEVFNFNRSKISITLFNYFH